MLYCVFVRIYFSSNAKYTLILVEPIANVKRYLFLDLFGFCLCCHCFTLLLILNINPLMLTFNEWISDWNGMGVNILCYVMVHAVCQNRLETSIKKIRRALIKHIFIMNHIAQRVLNCEFICTRRQSGDRAHFRIIITLIFHQQLVRSLSQSLAEMRYSLFIIRSSLLQRRIYFSFGFYGRRERIKMEFLWYDVTIWHRRFNYPVLNGMIVFIMVLICLNYWNWSFWWDWIDWNATTGLLLHSSNVHFCMMSICFIFFLCLFGVRNNFSRLVELIERHVQNQYWIENMWCLIKQKKSTDVSWWRSEQRRWTEHKGSRPMKQTKLKDIFVSFRSIENRLYQAELLNFIKFCFIIQ